MTGDIETYNMYESIPIKINHPPPGRTSDPGFAHDSTSVCA